MQHVKISLAQAGKRLKVQCPFNKKFVAVAGGSLGGAFDRDDRCWYLPAVRETQVRTLCFECFGNDGQNFLPSVIVHIRLDQGCPFLSPGVALLEGRILVKRRNEDDKTCFLGEGVRVISGGFSKNGRGSRVPVLRPKLSTLLEIIDVPLHVATRTNRNWPKWLMIAELMEQESFTGVVDVAKLLDDLRQRELAMCLSDEMLKEELERRKGVETKRGSPASQRAKRRMLGRIKTADEKQQSEILNDDLVIAMNEGSQNSAHEDELSGLMDMVSAKPVILKPSTNKYAPQPTPFKPNPFKGSAQLPPWVEKPDSDFMDEDGAVVMPTQQSKPKQKVKVSDEFMTQDELDAQEGMGMGNKTKKYVAVSKLDDLLKSPSDLIKDGYSPGEIIAMSSIAPIDSLLAVSSQSGKLTKSKLFLLQELLTKPIVPPLDEEDELDLDDDDDDDDDDEYEDEWALE